MQLTEQVPELTIDDISPETLQPLTDGQLLAVHAAFAKLWLKHQQNEPLPMELEPKVFLAKFQFVIDEFGRRLMPETGNDSDEQPEMQESFHLRGPHWIEPPETGPCPDSHPNRDTSPDGKLKCYTNPAHAALLRSRMQEQEEIPKLANEVLRLRPKDFPDGRCGLCRYFDAPTTCKIIEGPVEAEQVCDGFQGIEEGFPAYEVADEDWLAFVNGMVREQPYQHVVQSGHLTPEGPIVVIADTMKPKPHIFSLSKEFHVHHTSREHAWQQEEVDGLIERGRAQMNESQEPLKEAFHIRGTHWEPLPASGQCSGEFSVRARFPGRDLTVCFTPAAARAAAAERSSRSE